MVGEAAGAHGDAVREVLSHYPVAIQAVEPVQVEEPRSVWRVWTSEGALALKRHPHPPDRALFCLAAQVHVRKARGPVPSVLRTRGGKLFVLHQGAVFSLQEWVPGRHPDFRNPGDLQGSVRGLAAFHRASRGYRPPEGARVSSRLGRWLDQYGRMQRDLQAWKGQAAEREPLPLAQAYLGCIDRILEIAAEAGLCLKASAYFDWVRRHEVSPVICHQDYGPGNVVLSGQRVWVLDLDGVTFDLPARDLRKLTLKVTARRWDLTVVHFLLDHYAAVHPLADGERQVVLVDLFFPHTFYATVKKLFKKKREPAGATTARSLEEVARWEEEKARSLRPLLP